jgi:hypothetical protein
MQQLFLRGNTLCSLCEVRTKCIFIMSINFNLQCSVLWPRRLSPAFHCGSAGSSTCHSMWFCCSVTLLFIPILCFPPISIVPPMLHNRHRHDASLSDGEAGKHYEPSSKSMHLRKSGSMGWETTSTLSFPRINQVSAPVRLYRHELSSVAISHNFNIKFLNKKLYENYVFSNIYCYMHLFIVCD